MFFNATVKSHFDYCDIIWGNYSKVSFEKVFRLPNRAVRILTGVVYLDHSESLSNNYIGILLTQISHSTNLSSFTKPHITRLRLDHTSEFDLFQPYKIKKLIPTL